MQEFKGTFRKIDVLILDDVQFLANRERTQEEFFHTFNALHEARRQIVLTSDKVPKHIPGLEERLRNRFEWGLIADIQPPDMETRVAILEKKAELEGLELPRDVAIHLASKIDSNVRELEGSLTRLSAVASVSKTPITVEFARNVLQDVLKDRKPITVDAIQSAVCEAFHVHLTDLVSPRRSADIALARHVAMYLTRRLTKLSYPNIGERFGHRDHTTVIHGERTVARKMTDDQHLRGTVEQLEHDLQNRT
jgi:chromosomal replication initiator protein